VQIPGGPAPGPPIMNTLRKRRNIRHVARIHRSGRNQIRLRHRDGGRKDLRPDHDTDADAGRNHPGSHRLFSERKDQRIGHRLLRPHRREEKQPDIRPYFEDPEDSLAKLSVFANASGRSGGALRIYHRRQCRRIGGICIWRGQRCGFMPLCDRGNGHWRRSRFPRGIAGRDVPPGNGAYYRPQVAGRPLRRRMPFPSGLFGGACLRSGH